MDIFPFLNPDLPLRTTVSNQLPDIPNNTPVSKKHSTITRSKLPTIKLSKTRPGPTSHPIAIRAPWKFAKPKVRTQRSYTREFKIQCLEWWAYGTIIKKDSPSQITRSPYCKDVHERYLVPMQTLYGWKQNESVIINSTKNTRMNRTGVKICRWPELEAAVYLAYREHRDNRLAVRRGLLRRFAKDAFIACYPTRVFEEEFRFSNGWLFGFLSRHDITIRFTTNKSQKIPEDYLNIIIQWFQFNRRNSQIRKGDIQEEVGRYRLKGICNMDETPIPFEYLDGQTYADKGSRTVQIKTSRSGWDKRQATLVLAVFADGSSEVKPLILFKGAEKYEGKKADYLEKQRKEEMDKYDSRVVVKWNKKAYANEKILCSWIIDMLVPALPSGPRLLALDVARFHKTDAVLDTLRSYDIIPSMIPPGCTGLVQPLDVSVNKPLKNLLRDLLEDALDRYHKKNGYDLRETQKTDSNAVAERRILITWCVGEAWEFFCEHKKDLIINTFRKVGLSLPIDGSCDKELSINGIKSEDLIIGDWRLKKNTQNTQEIERWGDIGGPGDHGPEGIDEENCNIGENDFEEELGIADDENEAAEFVDRD